MKLNIIALILGLSMFSSACVKKSGSGENDLEEAVKKAEASTAGYVVNPLAAPLGDKAWRYFSHRNYGVREDAEGFGHFISPRGTSSRHTGIDFLQHPVGTTLYAPCDGIYLAGTEANYGNWVQIICKSPISNHYISMLYGHMSQLNVPTGSSFSQIKKATKIGFSGKSGNASSDGILSHLHFETIVLANQELAKNEMHRTSAGGVDTQASKDFMSALRKSCLNHGVETLKSEVNKADPVQAQYGDRIDPFLVFVCFSKELPLAEKFGAPLTKPKDKQVPMGKLYKLPASLSGVLGL